MRNPYRPEDLSNSLRNIPNAQPMQRPVALGAGGNQPLLVGANTGINQPLSADIGTGVNTPRLNDIGSGRTQKSISGVEGKSIREVLEAEEARLAAEKIRDNTEEGSGGDGPPSRNNNGYDPYAGANLKSGLTDAEAKQANIAANIAAATVPGWGLPLSFAAKLAIKNNTLTAKDISDNTAKAKAFDDNIADSKRAATARATKERATARATRDRATAAKAAQNAREQATARATREGAAKAAAAAKDARARASSRTTRDRAAKAAASAGGGAGRGSQSGGRTGATRGGDRGDGLRGGGDGGGNGGGDGSGCFAKGTLFRMADDTYKVVEDIKTGDEVYGGTVLKTRTGASDRDFYNYNGTIMTDEHFVLEDGTWKYVFEADQAELVEPFDTYYTMDTTNHRLYGVNDEVFTDDAVFDSDHPIHTKPYVKETWDEMLEILNTEHLTNPIHSRQDSDSMSMQGVHGT